MTYLFKINLTRIKINPTRIKNQPSPKIKLNLSSPSNRSLLSPLVTTLYRKQHKKVWNHPIFTIMGSIKYKKTTYVDKTHAFSAIMRRKIRGGTTLKLGGCKAPTNFLRIIFLPLYLLKKTLKKYMNVLPNSLYFLL